MQVAIVYLNFGPYHIARLEATGAVGQITGNKLAAIEIASQQSDYRWPEIREPGIHYTRHTLFADTDYWSIPYVRMRRALSRRLNQIKPDVLVLPGWGFKESVAGLGWSLRRKVPRVVISDSQAIDRQQTLGRRVVKQFLLHLFQTALVGGQPHVRYLEELGFSKEHCYVGCDVVDNGFFERESQEWKKLKPPMTSTPVILSCIRLLPRKNVPGVIQVLARNPQWTWIIAGDGSQRPEIETEIQRMGLAGRVQLLGHVNYFELPSVYARAHVYLQPSLSEPWGLAVNEAMACGLPVLVSNRCGCHEDLVKDGVNGFVFDPESGLSAALEKMEACRERWMHMGECSQEIINRWGLDLFARNLWQCCEAAQRLFSVPSHSVS
ncbi:MAG: glycosyltransferase family 4 protein [Acidobacteria bacterium]|nr:glycosyltransferase family 4 protein [Acidobacteriota bacterium]